MSFTDQFSKIELPHFGMIKLPKIVITSKQKEDLGLKDDAPNQSVLLALARVGYKKKQHLVTPEKKHLYVDRVKTELSTFEELGFTDYVLLVWMVINKAREMGVFIDFGRGSCSGSIIFWLLGLTGVDPIAKQLLFERFVSRVRSKKQIINGEIYLQGDLIADADLNLGNGRDKIVEWLKTIYPNAVCKIITHGTLTGKVLVKDVCKVFDGKSDEEARSISSILESKFGIIEDIEEAYDKHPEFKKWADDNEETYKICLQLRGLIRQVGVHASGYMITATPFDGFLPIQLNKDGEPMSSFNMQDVSNFGPKLDLLGLTTNRIIQEVLNKTGEDVDKINLDDDPFIYDRFQDGKLLPFGLYQISADCAYRVTQAIKPKNIFELSDVSSIARPGALAYLKDYVDHTKASPHPLFDSILKPTRNLCLYQESMMQMAVAVGFTLEEAETLRKIVGKKLVDQVKVWKQKIYERVEKSSLPPEIGDILWKILDDSSKYSFNLSHSVSTSYLTALTVYLKYKYPQIFMCACLNATNDLPDPNSARAEITQELRKMGIKLFSPDLMISKDDFVVEGDGIRYGLSYVKGVSDATILKFSSFKKNFSSSFEMFEGASSAKIPINILVSLIYAGCLDTKNRARSLVALHAQLYNLLTDREKPIVHKLASEYKEDLIAILKALGDLKNEKGKPVIKASRLDTIRRDYAPYWNAYLENSKNEDFCNYIFERNLLGFSPSNTLHNIFSQKVIGLSTIGQILSVSPDKKEKLKCVGFVGDDVKTYVSKKDGTPYLKMTIGDETGSIKIMIYGKDKLEGCKSFNGNIPREGDLILVIGSMARDGGIMFCDSLVIQPSLISFKITS